MVYTSSTLSLALLENLVYNLNLGLIEKTYNLCSISFPKVSVQDSITIKKLPYDWKQYPAPDSTKKIGDTWLRNAKKPILKIPSVIVSYSYPMECNFLINPAFENISNIIKIGKITPFDIDTRLRKN